VTALPGAAPVDDEPGALPGARPYEPAAAALKAGPPGFWAESLSSSADAVAERVS